MGQNILQIRDGFNGNFCGFGKWRQADKIFYFCVLVKFNSLSVHKDGEPNSYSVLKTAKKWITECIRIERRNCSPVFVGIFISLRKEIKHTCVYPWLKFVEREEDFRFGEFEVVDGRGGGGMQKQERGETDSRIQDFN